MCGALGADQLIRGRLVAVCLHALLQERLGVRGVLGTLGGQVRLKRTVDELRRRIPTGIQIQRAHERLVNVLKRRMQAARAGTGLGGAKDDDVVDTSSCDTSDSVAPETRDTFRRVSLPSSNSG